MDPLIRKNKLESAIRTISKLDIDLWLVITREDNLDPIAADIGAESIVGPSAFLFTQNEMIAIVANFDAEAIRATQIYDSVYAYDKEGLFPHIKKEISRLSPNTVALNFSEDEPVCDGLSLGLWNILKRTIPDYEKKLISAEEIVMTMRSVKTEEEISRIKKAANITEKILEEVADFTKLGMSEVDVAQIVRGRVTELNLDFAWPKDHCPSVTIGSHPAGHLGPQEQYILERGDLMRLDFGVRYKGYCADIQRVYYALDRGESSPPERLRHMFQTASESLEAGLSVLKPGARGIDIDTAARKVVVDAKYPEFIHAYGHSLGRIAHGVGPLLGPYWPGRYSRSRVYRVIQENETFTAEPSVEYSGVGWINLEDDVVVRKHGVERLSGPQEDFYYIE